MVFKWSKTGLKSCCTPNCPKIIRFCIRKRIFQKDFIRKIFTFDVFRQRRRVSLFKFSRFFFCLGPFHLFLWWLPWEYVLLSVNILLKSNNFQRISAWHSEYRDSSKLFLSICLHQYNISSFSQAVWGMDGGQAAELICRWFS
jgi:hypothetical protein